MAASLIVAVMDRIPFRIIFCVMRMCYLQGSMLTKQFGLDAEIYDDE